LKYQYLYKCNYEEVRTMEREMERVIMKLITNGGDARSFSLKAIQHAEKALW